LIFQKEGFGARVILYDIYEYTVTLKPEDELFRNVVFEKFNEYYLRDSLRWFKDQEIKLMMDAPDFTSISQNYWFQNLPQRHGYLIWGINYLGRRIGSCGLKSLSCRSAEYWGYIGDKNLWGRGLGKVILMKCIQAATDLRLDNLYLKVINSNERAINLYRNFDFKVYNQDGYYIYMKKKL
jgi:RimJ/RimL family protein N-acetyltransferase